MKRVILTFLFVCLLAFPFSFVAALEAEASIEVQVDPEVLSVDEEFTVDLFINNATDLYGFSFNMIFDPNVTKVVYNDETPDDGGFYLDGDNGNNNGNTDETGPVTSGDLFDSFELNCAEAVNRLNNVEGTLEFAELVIGEDDGVNISEKTLAASVTFRAMSKGDAYFRFASYDESLDSLDLEESNTLIQLSDSNGERISYEDLAHLHVNVEEDVELVVDSIEISGPDTLTIPDSDFITEDYTSVVKDQFGSPMDDETVTWSLEEAVTGVSVDEATGQVTVDDTAAEGSLILLAVSDSNPEVSESKTVALHDSVSLPTVTVGSKEGIAGSIVSIPITIDFFDSIMNYGITIEYDPAVLTPVSDDVGGGISGDILGANFDYNESFSENSIRVGDWEGVGSTEGSTFATVKFKVNEDAKAGTTTELKIVDEVIFDGDSQRMQVNTIEGLIEIIDVIYGDIDGDGVITPNDASLAFRYFMGYEQFDSLHKKAADVDGDGVITPNDASLIFRHFMGYITKFPVESN